MAESLLLPVVRAAAGKAGDVLVQSVAGMWGVDDDRRKLERQLVAIQCKLVDAEMKSETNPAIKIWMKHLKAAAYEADDILDDFQYEALRREDQIGKSTTRKVLSYFTLHSPLLFRLTMGWKLNNILKKINELVTEMNTFGLENRVEAPSVIYRQTHSALDDSAEIFGRDNDKEEVVKLLLAQQDQQKVQVLPVFGMGGLGKTTLAKMVYNDCRIQQHFQLKMWHCVSDNFDAVAIVKSIIELATNKRPDLSDTIELLRRRLEDEISRKRFLLVLDDVWNEEEKKWDDELKPLLCSVGGPGSVIIVTCRSQQVASIMCTLQPHELACLTEDDSWELFSRKAFSHGVEVQSKLVTIGRRIVKKCRGLPLAVKTMAGLMSSKQQVDEWEIIEQSNIGDNVKGKHEILPILKLSYRHLSSEMKQCFAFCAVFPKDYRMDKDMLIQLWMANGFVQEEETMNLVQKGEFIFHVLVWRSFLHDVEANELGVSVSCKMHDLMHDLAKDVTDECETIEELIHQKASLEGTYHIKVEPKQNIGPLKGTKSLRTLLAPYTSNKNLMEIKLMQLRALTCEGPSIVHSQIISAKHLRYLDLSRSNFFTFNTFRLPDSICLLYNLQTLRLNYCSWLRRLPEGITAMRKLIHLYISGCHSLERMPPNISLLNNLCTLTTFVVDTEPGRGIEELKDLCRLGNKLELYNLRKIKSVQNAKKANLHQKQNLTELLLCRSQREEEQPKDEACNEEEVLESLTPHGKLRSLELYGYAGLEISQWMRDPRMFQYLRKLTVSNCPRCKDIPIVWLSDSLEYLSARNMGNLSTLCKSIEVEAEGYNTPLQLFPKLKEMFLSKLPNLERWVENCDGECNSLLMFPCLQTLRIINCPKLASVPGSLVLKTLTITGSCNIPNIPIFSWPSLVNLEISSLASMMMPLEDQRSQSQTRHLETLRNLSLYGPNWFVTTPGLSKSHLGMWECFAFVEELSLCGCTELVCWPVKELHRLVCLRTLFIGDCANLEGKGSSSTETFLLPQLKSIHMYRCPSLMEIPNLPASLEKMQIRMCGNLVALPSNLGDLAKLKYLDVECCDSLKELAAGMDGLTSLQHLTISDCGGIEGFPQGLLQRLPALKSLYIYDCPELARCCREGGEYFHLVSSIPAKDIKPAETELSGKKKFLRKLLPSCGDSN